MGHIEFHSQVACPHWKSNHRTYYQKLSFYQENRQSYVLRSGCIVVQSLSHVQLFASPWTAARQASLSFTISWSLLRLMSIESVMPSNHLILCFPLLLLPSVFPSIRVFSNESALCIRWPQSIGVTDSASILPMNIQGWFPLGLVWSPCCPRDSQESSPTPQFETVTLCSFIAS